MKRLLATLVLSTAMLAPSATPPALARSAPPTDAVGLRHALQSVVAGGAPGAVALVADGRRTRTAAIGSADLATGRRMHTDNRVRAGSITKTFVAVAALQLVAERRIRLDDPVGHWLPGVLPYADHITIRQLLNHTGGVPEYFDKLLQYNADHPGTPQLRHWDPADLVGFVAANPPLFTAGTGWQYSDTDYVLVGMIIEKVTHRTLAGEVDRRVIDRLRLRDTTFPTDETALPAPAARGYWDVGPGAAPLDVTEYNPSALWAAGAIVSTVDDIARFYKELLAGHLLPAPQMAQMLSFVDTGGGLGYGLGIAQIPTPCGPAIGHDGTVPGFATNAYSSTDGRRQVVVTANLYPGRQSEAQQELVSTLLCNRH
ncbi:serine hydrolase domain-containing protein [Krasilnikovia sp. MM14-A1259]|uniref:serine hydrolase domain-containing protein n=1 Tax=Krasilnikovia sp. MM14-A1259 TaxID=3373539 RepID=UPI00380B75E6